MTGSSGPLALCFGTRPQVIKASILLEALEAGGDAAPVITVDTGQHYDFELNRLLYEQLGVRPPDLFLEVGSSDHAAQTAAILTRAAEVFVARRPRAVVVIGDTNSTLGCALAAAKMRIPVVHVEAGLRSAELIAEEVNRRMVDAVSAVLCAPSANAEARLRRESAGGLIARTGDVARDVLIRNLARTRPAHAGAGWPLPPDTPFIFATLHRAELTDRPAVLGGALDALAAAGLPVIFAAHPRTRGVMERSGLHGRLAPAIHLLPPLGYLESLACVRDARVLVTDSGGLQREAYWLGTPCLTIRTETEWEETVELGANALVSPERAPAELAAAIRARLDGGARGWDRDAYGAGDGRVAGRIRAAIDAGLPA